MFVIPAQAVGAELKPALTSGFRVAPLLAKAGISR